MKNIFAILICVVLFTTCKKYPEGGYHFRYLKNLEGNWKLKLYEVDGVDSTMLTVGANTIPNYLDDFADIGSQKSRRVVYTMMTNHYRYFNVYVNPQHKLISFDNANDNGFDSLDCTIPNPQLCQKNIFNPKKLKSFAWKIEKLTKKEMVLISNSYNYKLILEKK